MCRPEMVICLFFCFFLPNANKYWLVVAPLSLLAMLAMLLPTHPPKTIVFLLVPDVVCPIVHAIHVPKSPKKSYGPRT